MEYNIGDVIKDEKRNLVITGKEKRKRTFYYQYKCNDCGYNCEDGYRSGQPVKGRWLTYYELNGQQKGCCCCANRIVVPDINSIRATNPEMSKYFLNNDDEKYTAQSNCHIDIICPSCNSIKNNAKISTLYRYGFSCDVCSISVSIGERIVSALLSFCNIDFEKEYRFENSNKRYDFYLYGYNSIVEVNGRQHYFEISGNWANRDEKTNDENKMAFALSRGIDKYIVIDARESDFDYIKNSILSSSLVDVVDISSVDWKMIKHLVNSNDSIKDICEYWENNKNATYVDMERLFHYSESTIVKYLKIGYEMGWCNKRPNKRNETHIKKSGYKRNAPLTDYSSDCRNNSNPVIYTLKNIYFKNSRLASEHSEECCGKKIATSTIRYKAKRNQDFAYVTPREFNEACANRYECYGTPFDDEVLQIVS